ncbi:FeoB-associated Cys-rich membrane protein [uncultured Gammaproteobacteria bacterium]
MWQSLIVFVVVAVAMVWTVWTYFTPAPLRARLRTLVGWPRPVTGTGCGGCGGCQRS